MLELSSALWIPLPVLGSIYPLYRSVSGHKQDIPNTDYQELIQSLKTSAHAAKNVIFASGHEHCLQYTKNGEMHFIVSGSASRKSYAQKGGDAEFVYAERGYSTLDFYNNGEVWLEFISVSQENSHDLQFKKQIIGPTAGTEVDTKVYADSKDLPESITTEANDGFKAKAMKKFLMGSQYREMWTSPLKVPVIDLKNTKGGLTPIKKGGGMASNSLRMENPDGHHYVLRSINKDYIKLLPENFKNLKAINIMKDQNSASHPYGALMIPSLSKAAGIYYTTPKLVYLQHQKQLGNYNDLFNEELYLLEERPSGDWSEYEAFGNSDEIISYADLLFILQSKKRHFVDQKWVLKSRLFDMWVHDWDRHDDQWRWATFKEEGKTICRPIPRDRDQVFYKFVGLLPRLMAIYAIRKFKTMDDVIRDVPGLAFNAKTFDRYFLNELEWQEWKEIVIQLQNDITEEDIKQSFEALPPEIRELQREELQHKLVRRKNDLLKYARKLYTFINKEIEIVGSDNKETFEIERLSNGSVRVKVYNHDHEERILKYGRTIEKEVTKEIRLFGLSGKDDFIFSGVPNNSIKIRIIGGEGKDEIIDNTEGKISNSVHVYDQLNGIKAKKGMPFKDRRSDKDVDVNEYERGSFKYNVGIPFLLLGYTPDDGFWMGLGGSFTKHGWRKKPFAAKHTYSGSFAPGVKNTFILNYSGIFTDAVFGTLDFAPNLKFSNPFYVNFFGLGNFSSDDNPDPQFNWVRMSNYGGEFLLKKSWHNDKNSFEFGPLIESY